MEDTACTYQHLDHANDLEPSVGHSCLRAMCPVHVEWQNDPPFVVVSRHDDALEILKRPDEWRNGDGPGVFVQRGGVLGAADNPDHDRQRRVLRPLSLPTVIARMEPKVAAVVDSMMDELVPSGAGDFVADYAFMMPALVIGAPLARMETRLTFDRVARRMFDIELSGEPVLSESFILRGFTSLPIRWRAG